MSELGTLIKTTKSLAQVLYEASPNVGWEGRWHALREDQHKWWSAFAEVAGIYLATFGNTGAHLISNQVDDQSVNDDLWRS